ncbi:MAG: HAD-IIA family hydrolase [Bacteroidetes bacterium]|jgi:HAD superfamily hydrolase (TIGR01450 family)|nr:HAD-IIA family hydrolase [Bacteroidota bacterium]
MDKVSFFSIVKNYKAVFLDSYGVLKNHQGLIEGVVDTIKLIRDEGIELRVLTNDASRSQLQQVQMFEDLGLTGLEEKEIITSGMLARQFLELKIKTGKFAYLGTENSANYIMKNGLTGIPVSDVDIENSSDVAAFVFLDDEGFDWHRDINRTINFLRRNNLPIIVANSDKYYPISRDDVAVAIGGLSRLCESVLNQKFIRFGKPDSQMFMFAYDDINKTGKFDKSEILMVGDTLHTDILGGNKFGLKTLLVLSGNTRSKHAEVKINSTGIIPDYIADSILE